METRIAQRTFRPDDAALDWSGKSRSARPARWTSLFGVDLWRANETKKARSVVALSRVPRWRTGCAGFASGCRLWCEEEVSSPGGYPASCPDAHQPTHGHRHVRIWASPHIVGVALLCKSFYARQENPGDFFGCCVGLAAQRSFTRRRSPHKSFR